MQKLSLGSSNVCHYWCMTLRVGIANLDFDIQYYPIESIVSQRAHVGTIIPLQAGGIVVFHDSIYE